VDDARSLNLLQGSLYLSKLLITKLYIYMYLYVFLNKANNHKHELPGQPCLLMDRDEMSNLYRGPSIDASYQVSVHLAQ
jgi:hypothetical protein